MKKRIVDPEVRVLASISEALKIDYKSDEEMWKNSPFGWIRTRQSRQKGAIGEKLVAGWLAARDFNIARSPDSEADRVVAKKRVEIKFSTLWTDVCTYTFQQLRDQKYDIAICLGISPFDAHCWVLEKKEILQHWQDKERTIVPQHGGKAGNDTAWFSVDPQEVPEWLRQYGGSLSDGLDRMSGLTGFSPPPLQ
jgi:hypothetical protein